MNTARAKAGIATADDKEVVDFAERLRYVLELKISKLRIAMHKSDNHLEADMSMTRIQALEWVQAQISELKNKKRKEKS